jgi:uncharacterized protein
MMLAVDHQSELDAGPRKSGRERFCALTREVKSIDDLIRFVIGPDGVVPDLKHKLPGRGLWITGTRDCVSRAVAGNIFARGFKRDVRAPHDLPGMLNRLLLRAALDALSIAYKAGAVVTGFGKTEDAIARKSVTALFHAGDAAQGGAEKLTAALRRRPDADGIKIISTFSTAELDLALGRSNVVHAALLAGPESEAFLARYARLVRFQSGDPAGAQRIMTSESEA